MFSPRPLHSVFVNGLVSKYCNLAHPDFARRICHSAITNSSQLAMPGKRGRERRKLGRGAAGVGAANEKHGGARYFGHDALKKAPHTDASDSSPQREATSVETRRFAELANQNLVHPTILEAITDDLKFDQMMPVQAATLWELLPPKRSDCLVQAKTGTGKTVAFLLPALQTILNKKNTSSTRRGAAVSLLVISPTRELAMQIAQEAKSLLNRLPEYRVCIAIGGTSKNKEEKQIVSGCDVLVATPGRLNDHLETPAVFGALQSLDTLVLDEADRLLEMGFLADLKKIVAKLPDRAEVPRQGMLFSATIASHVKQVAGLVCKPNYKFISTIPEGEVNTHERVPQHLIKVPNFAAVAPAMVGVVRQEAEAEMAKTNGRFKAILFAPTAAAADFLGHVLSQFSDSLPPVSMLHSRLSQGRRTTITDAFRKAESGILVATDVIARGMDFPGVTTVFQIGLPLDKQSYIHRLGRTARANADGKGIFMVTEDEKFFPLYKLKEISFVPREADYSAQAKIDSIMDGMEEDLKAKVYRAWLGYYNNHLKGLGWDKEELVQQGNLYAKEGLRAPDPLPIEKSMVGKMGLKGVRGLHVVPNRPREPQGGRQDSSQRNEGGSSQRQGGGGFPSRRTEDGGPRQQQRTGNDRQQKRKRDVSSNVTRYM